MAPPKKPIDEDDVLSYASVFCTDEEIALEMGVSVSTITRRCEEILKKGKNRSKLSLRAKQFELAMKGNVTMLIWLGKQHLGQSNKFEATGGGYDGFCFVKPPAPPKLVSE